MKNYIDVEDCSYTLIREHHQFYHIILKNVGQFATQSYEFALESSLLPDQLLRHTDFFNSGDLSAINTNRLKGKKKSSRRQCKVLLGLGLHAVKIQR
eukprot:UN27726